MVNLTLSYDITSDNSMPELNIIDGVLQQAELAKLKAEINRRYQEFSTLKGENIIVDFKTPLPSIHQGDVKFFLTIDRSSQRRNPSLRFILVNPDSKLLDHSSSPNTKEGTNDELFCPATIFEELDKLLNKVDLSDSEEFEKSNLRVSIEELKNLLKVQDHLSEITTIFLVSGYLEMASRYYHDRDIERSSCYHVATRAIERVLNSISIDENLNYDITSSISGSHNNDHADIHRPMPNLLPKLLRFLGNKLRFP